MDKKREADLALTREMLVRVLDPSRGKIKKPFLDEMSKDRMKDYNVLIFGVRDSGKLTSDLSYILRQHHKFSLKTNTLRPIGNEIIFTGSTTYASILSICREPWVTEIVSDIGKVRVQD